MAEMTKEAIEKCLKEHDGYKQPLLNDQLYLHCKGFLKIEPVIGEYENVKALWLQQNALSKIENLEELKMVGCLYLHQNCITSMVGLEVMSNLHTVNLSQNYITNIEGVQGLPHLETLLISHNRIADLKGLEGLRGCGNLSCLDISHNGLRCEEDAEETPQDLMDLLKTLPSLACLYIQGNEVSNQTRYFRRKMVGSLKSLTFMDERPVFDDDRRATDAWMVGGFEAEQAERDAIREEKRVAEKASLEKYKAMQEAARVVKEAREAELEKIDAAKKKWMQDNKTEHEKERKTLMNEEEDELTTIHKLYKGQSIEIEDEMEKGLVAVRCVLQQKLDEAAAKEQAKLEIEKEEQAFNERRQSYAESIKREKLTRDEELAFLQKEAVLLEKLERQSTDAVARQFEALLTQPLKAQPKPTHKDPNETLKKRGSSNNNNRATVWETYSKWELRRK